MGLLVNKPSYISYCVIPRPDVFCLHTWSAFLFLRNYLGTLIFFKIVPLICKINQLGFVISAWGRGGT